MNKINEKQNQELNFLAELPDLDIDISQEGRMKNNKVTVTFELEDNQAWELAQLAKRITFTHFQELSDPTNLEEPYVMRSAIYQLQDALKDAGYAPR